jgi:hypothetical protein
MTEKTSTHSRSGWGNDTFHGLHRTLGRDNQDIMGARGALFGDRVLPGADIVAEERGRY